MVILALLGCGDAPPSCDDVCLGARAIEQIATDYEAALSDLRAIEDPLIATSAVMEMMHRSDVHLHAPDQTGAICGEAAPITQALCRDRFERVHLIDALHREAKEAEVAPSDRPDSAGAWEGEARPDAHPVGGHPGEGPPPGGPPPGAPPPP